MMSLDQIDQALTTPANRVRRLLAYRAIGQSIQEMAIEWAKAEIYAGADGESLAMLAGLWGQLDSVEIEGLLDKALVEAERDSPAADHLLDYACLLCSIIFEGRLEWKPALEELGTLAGHGPVCAAERLVYWTLFYEDAVSVMDYDEPPNFFPKLTKDTIAECLREEAASFLRDHCPTWSGDAAES